MKERVQRNGGNSCHGLIKRIEELRLDLVEIKIGRAYTDPEVISASRKLDEVLNEYQELVNPMKAII